MNLDFKTYDYVSMGAGPGGATAGAVLAALSDKRVCLLDIRPTPLRHHGLRIMKKTVALISTMLTTGTARDFNRVQKQNIDNLLSIFRGWTDDFVKTSDIENQLKVESRKFGAKILRREEYSRYLNKYYLKDLIDPNKPLKSEEEIDQDIINGRMKTELKRQLGSIENVDITLLQDQIDLPALRNKFELELEKEKAKVPFNENPEDPDTHANPHKQLKEILCGAKVIIAADGAKSQTREVFLGNDFHDEITYQHVIELKYFTKGKTRSRNFIQGKTQSSRDGNIQFESMSPKFTKDPKPATLHIFDWTKETYERLEELKKDRPLTLELIQELAKVDPLMFKFLKTVERHIESVNSRDGEVTNLTFNIIPLAIYQVIKTVVRVPSGQIIAALGDAESGLIIQEGFNKTLIQAVHIALCSLNLFKTEIPRFGIPQEFLDYQAFCKELFETKKAAIEFKNYFITAAQMSTSATHKLVFDDGTPSSISYWLRGFKFLSKSSLGEHSKK